MKLMEWSVMDAVSVRDAIEAVGIHIPKIHGWTCDTQNRNGFTCDRLERHTGRHAATLGDGTLVAVWSAPWSVVGDRCDLQPHADGLAS